MVEALFELPADHPAWQRLGLTVPGEGPGELLVRRTVSRGGRGRASVNGTLCTVSMLEAALRGVVDISGQHEHVTLLDPTAHLELLDAFCASSFDSGPAAQDPPPGQPDARPPRGGGHPLLGRYHEAYAALAALVRERDSLAADEGERARRADYLAFLLRELDAVDPRPGEIEELEAERRVLASAEKLREAARSAEGLSYGEEGSASERVGEAVRALADASALDARLAAPLGLLRSAAAELEEAGRELGRYAELVGGDPDRLAAVEDRLELLRALARKHGGSLENAVARRAAMREELGRITGGDDRLAELAKQIEARGAEALRMAQELTRLRAEAGRRLAEAVERELSALAMGRCRIQVAFLPPMGESRSAGTSWPPAARNVPRSSSPPIRVSRRGPWRGSRRAASSPACSSP